MLLQNINCSEYIKSFKCTTVKRPNKCCTLIFKTLNAKSSNLLLHSYLKLFAISNSPCYVGPLDSMWCQAGIYLTNKSSLHIHCAKVHICFRTCGKYPLYIYKALNCLQSKRFSDCLNSRSWGIAACEASSHFEFQIHFNTFQNSAITFSPRDKASAFVWLYMLKMNNRWSCWKMHGHWRQSHFKPKHFYYKKY